MSGMTVGKIGSNFGNGNGNLRAVSADGSGETAAMLANGLPPPRLLITRFKWHVSSQKFNSMLKEIQRLRENTKQF